jgi:hypothetical protein
MARRRGAELTLAVVQRAMEGERDAIVLLVERVTPAIQVSAARARLRVAVTGGLRHEVEAVTLAVIDHLFASGGADLPREEGRLERWAEDQVARAMRNREGRMSDPPSRGDTPSGPS